MIISKKINYLIILIFFGLWTSLGSDPYDFLIIFEGDLILQNIFELKLVNIINFFRALVPLGCLVICFVIIIKYKIYKHQNKLNYYQFPIFIRPILLFFYRYIFKKGYLDGIAGFFFSSLSFSLILLIFTFCFVVSINAQDKVFVASVGIGSVRVTGACAKGDLLESNGDGTAKVQSDDIIRSKTIGKVTIGNSNTDEKLVSCVLYCG